MEYPENNENSPNQEILKNEIAQKEVEEKLDDLENLIKENAILGYNPTCVRKKSNWSKSSQIYRFDNPEFNPEIFLKDMPDYSPKLNSLMHKIEELDKEDKRKHGKLFKHFIFSDLKSSAYGAKMIASAFVAKGYTLGYESKPKNNIVGGEDPKGPEKKRYHKIELLEDEVLQQTLQNNFYILSSVGVYDQPIPVILKKEMLKKYNQRPENIQGENIRFIILDSGFKEGIDLFDIKYIHIFEPSIVSADQKQVIGRGTRTCGQKGLDFHPTQGWILNVFVYDLSIPEKLQKSFLNTKSTMELYFKSMNLDIRLINFAHDIERTTVLGSVDYELNKNVHSFSIPFISADEEEDRVLLDEHVNDDVELLYGGSDIIPKKRKLIVRPGPPINRPLQGPLGFEKMREFIRDNYSEFAWDKVKMENLCDEKNQKGGNIIKYTPTQDFIRHYFNPAFPMKGMLLYHGTGVGKTCSAIAASTQNFEKNGYTILWVTRTTLKSDIWKNMFDQICNETIRNMIKKDNLEIPNDQQKRMRLLSKAWRIRPMSYKQFSNLILRQNALYDTLVKINGKEDPLRKTLLVIDEAHKLYGGDDLSSIEKPDMNALHQALMYSYQYSGADSVRLLLMTATPITKDPMELIQLLNLCKPAEQQMPADFSNFSTEYLNENGEFTDRGRTKYLDDIAGLVSYLNREKDARQFSQPKIHHINTPIISDIKMAEKFDKKLVQDLLDTNVSDLREQIQEENEKLEGELGQVNAEKFAFLKDEICGDKSGPSKSKCIKIVNAGIRDMVLEAKDQVKDVREKIKEIRERIKERGQMKKTALAEVKENIEKYADEYEKYKSSLLYELKDSCAIKIGDKTTLDEKMHEHPVIHKYDLLIKEYNDEIKYLDQQLKNLTSNYKKRMEHLKHLLKTDLNDVERSVVNSTIRDEQKEYGSMIRLKRRETEKAEKVIKTNISNIEKKRTQRYNKIRKTVKNMITNEKQRIREYKQEKKMLRKTMKSQQKNIKHDFLKGLINKYRSRILEDLVDIDKNNIVKNENKITEKEEKEKMKLVKKAAKEEEKIQKENNKTMKKREKEEDKNRKNREKEMEKTRKNREREEDKKRKIKEKEEEKARKMREKEMKRDKK
jgi:hypothetical protein